jgi:hypothetical protein
MVPTLLCTACHCRRAKRQLCEDLAKPAAQQTFINSMSDIVTDDAQLRRCLLPMEVTNEVCRNQHNS